MPIDDNRHHIAAGRNLPYPLRGGRLGHRVVTVPLDGGPVDLLPHEYAERLGARFAPGSTGLRLPFERGEPDAERWYRRIVDEGIEYVALYVHFQPLPELAWVGATPERFERLGDDPTGRLWIFRVVENAGVESR